MQLYSFKTIIKSQPTLNYCIIRHTVACFSFYNSYGMAWHVNTVSIDASARQFAVCINRRRKMGKHSKNSAALHYYTAYERTVRGLVAAFLCADTLT